MTYDRSELEIMSPPFRRDNRKHVLARLVIALTEECGYPLIGGGSTTLRIRRKRRGLEPDECFWIAAASTLEGREDLDLRRDPPPDLAFEIDVTSCSLRRIDIYDALCVPEVWRLHAEGLNFLIRQATGGYASSDVSLSFPWLRSSDLLPFLEDGRIGDQNRIIRAFRTWIQGKRTTANKPNP